MGGCTLEPCGQVPVDLGRWAKAACIDTRCLVGTAVSAVSIGLVQVSSGWKASWSSAPTADSEWWRDPSQPRSAGELLLSGSKWPEAPRSWVLRLQGLIHLLLKSKSGPTSFSAKPADQCLARPREPGTQVCWGLHVRRDFF